MGKRATEVALRTLASHRLGLVTTSGALAIGISENELHARSRSGVLMRVYRGVYVSGLWLASGREMSFEQRALAACLACGPGSFASHGTAGAIWEMTERRPDAAVSVTVPASRRPRVPGIRIHRSGFRSSEYGMRRQVPVASPSRTLLDLAAELGRDDLERAADEAFRRKLVQPEGLLAYLGADHLRNAKGIATLRGIAGSRLADAVPESVLETEMVLLIRRYGLPEPQRQVRLVVGGRRVRFDFAYPDHMLALEVDGMAPHLERERWEADHARNNATSLRGWRVLRFTWAQVTASPTYVAMTIADALALEPSRLHWKPSSADR